MVQKLERQMSLLATLLHSAAGLTKREIHVRVPGYPDDDVAFDRAFARDKEDLRYMGVPLDEDEHLYRVRGSDYYLHGLGLDQDETVALAMALRLIKLEGSNVDDAVWKLGGTARDQAPAEIGTLAMAPAVAVVHEVIKNHQSLRFTYRGERRLIEPWTIAFKGGHWYVRGWDVDRAAERSFRLDRVEGSFEEAGRPATQPRGDAASDRKPWEFGTEEQAQQALIRVDASHASWARRQVGDKAIITDRDDGSIDLELTVTDIAGFRNLVLGMLEAAHVIGPPALRDEMIAWLEAVAQ